MTIKKKLCSLLAVSVPFLCSCAGTPRDAAPVQNFDKERYLGKWYEVARFDLPFERNLSNTSAEYTFRDDGFIRVKNRGFNDVKQKWSEVEGKAKFTGSDKVAALKVSFFGPFYGEYNVVALDSAYTYALIAGGSLKYLWILSRTKDIPVEVKTAYLEKATAMGYDVSKLIWVRQDGK